MTVLCSTLSGDH
ncbi:hypothetical protein F383_36521 [Gossypium arboreum]|nr:hypothetical protein F383_36521 [Gossypium arboreum]